MSPRSRRPVQPCPDPRLWLILKYCEHTPTASTLASTFRPATNALARSADGDQSGGSTVRTRRCVGMLYAGLVSLLKDADIGQDW